MRNLSLNPIGMNVDIAPSRLPADQWSGGNNVSFADNASKPAEPYRNLGGAALFNPVFVLPNRNPTVFYWLYAAANGVGVYDGNTHTDLTPVGFNGGTIGQWTGANLNNLAMLNTPNEPPWYWDGNPLNNLVAMPGWPAGTTAGFLRAFKFMAIAGDLRTATGDFENQLLWSAAAEPGAVPSTWTPTPENEAGDNILAATPGSLIDGMGLRNVFMIFKNHSMYTMQLVSGQQIFEFRKLSESSGILANNCAAEYFNQLFVMTDGDILMTDGHQMRSIAERRVKTTIFSELDIDNYQTSFVVPYQQNNEVWFCYPTIGNDRPNKAAVYNVQSDRWGFRDLPLAAHIGVGLINDLNPNVELTWAALTPTWENWNIPWGKITNKNDVVDGLIMAIEADTALYAFGQGDSNTPTITSRLEKLSIPIEPPLKNKHVLEFWPHLNGTNGQQVKIRIGGQDHENDPIAWGVQQTFNLGADEKVDVDVRGRLISIEYEHTEPMQIHGGELRYRIAGRY